MRGAGATHPGGVALKSNPAQAARHFEKSIAILQEIKAENELALAYAGYGRLHNQRIHLTKSVHDPYRAHAQICR